MNNEATFQCPNCGEINRANANFCRNCRTTFKPGTTTERITPIAPPNSLTDLPGGALVNNLRYEILNAFLVSPTVNGYVVADENNNGAQWLLYESPNAAEYQRAQLALDRNVQHPHLARIGETFHEAQFDNAARGYMTLEYPLAPLQPQTRLNEVEVLKWGQQLAEALDALHRANLAHNQISPAAIMTSGDRIKLSHLTGITPLTEPARKQDMLHLAAALQTMMHPQGQTALLSPLVNQVLERALIPNVSNAYATAGAFAAAFREAFENKRRPAGINLRVGRLTDVGVKRELNEDAYATAEIARAIQKGVQTLGMYVVSDGMGGAAAGELASQIVTDMMVGEFYQTIAPQSRDRVQTQADFGALLKTAGEKANKAVFDERQRLRNDMGATLVAALVVGANAHLINVGDSRAYLVRGSTIQKISKDHSLVQSLVDSNQIAESEVRTHPQRNMITRNIGEKSNVPIDLFPPIALQPGDFIFLCSDGMWEMAEDKVVQELISKTPDPQTAVQKLIALANDNGGDDNITCVLVRVEAMDAAKN